MPSSVTNANALGDKGLDVYTFKARDQSTGVETTIPVIVVQGAPTINHTSPAGTTDAGVDTPGTTPQDDPGHHGPMDPFGPWPGVPSDEDNWQGLPPKAEPCILLKPPTVESGTSVTSSGPQNPESACGCEYAESLAQISRMFPPYVAPDDVTINSPGGGGMTNSPSFGGAMFCAANLVYSGSQAWVRPYGTLQLKSGCGALITRGQPVELCTWFENVPDGLRTAEQIAGPRSSFGWQIRLIQDTTGNVAIYWGDRSVEGWKTSDGGSTFVAPKGNFGSLTKQGDGSFTRVTKDLVYYDFDSNGRIQTVKDRSTDGNPVYYNYNGSNQVVRITGPGLGYKPYFEYNGGGRVSKMNLEAAGWPERTTYYDYDGSGRLTKMIWPEGCISYFDYDADNNVKEHVNADNFRTYFNYGSQTIPRLREINTPMSGGIYFTYVDSVPRQTRAQADGPAVVTDYQWAGLPLVQSLDAETIYFEYDANAKPVMAMGTDGVRRYFEWDSAGQVTSVRDCEDSLQYFSYGAAGRMTSWKDAGGRTTYWNYDAKSYQTNIIDPAGKVKYFERDSFGLISSEKDRRGNLTYYTYNSQGLVTSAKFADLTLRYFDYNAAGETEKVIDELANTAYYHCTWRLRLAIQSRKSPDTSDGLG